MRFRDAIFRSMAASWAPNEEPARLARKSIDSLPQARVHSVGRSFVRSFVRRNDYEKRNEKNPALIATIRREISHLSGDYCRPSIT